MNHVLTVCLALSLLCACVSDEAPLTDQVLAGVHVPASTLERGRALYGRYCASCHGPGGDAATPLSRQLDPPPASFAAAAFRHKSTPGDSLPTHDDLVRTVRSGVAGTAMPAWSHIPADDLDAVVHYLKTFSPRWMEAAVNTRIRLPLAGGADSFRAARDSGVVDPISANPQLASRLVKPTEEAHPAAPPIEVD